MTILYFTLILFLGAIAAGMLGSLTGLGGGVVIIPLLTLGFDVDIKYAVGTALVTSIATSSGAAAAYIKEGITNVRIGMFLEIATTAGAVLGALVAVYLPISSIYIILGITLIFSSVMTVRKKNQSIDYSKPGSKLGTILKLNGSYPTSEGIQNYNVRNVAGGFSLMTLAGILSGILGIGSGSLKVLAMDTAMKIPFKVSTTTSNFMVGVTAAASAVIYFQRGQINPELAMPIVLGVLIGAFFGSKILMRIDVSLLRKIFSIVIAILALQMIYRGIEPSLVEWFPHINFPKI
ncbi:sulfite exporter TauE/SafE family protein [Apibacter sp. HY039]|uniref:sulfite exporter TauE/SafE family protein n=1 Tax=Apibacter sp. HY039 TaxID=2501476 RepID=UPI000FEBCADF|nr:sulfite exporter TauE/SafE family protein [Apibacter sp. HY039]